MSLIVSLRVPDGIVVAADSLSTAQHLVEIAVATAQHQDQSGKSGSPPVKIPPISIPFSASSYTQKLFSFHRKYAICSVGQGIINGKSVYYHLRQFEKDTSDKLALKEVIEGLIKYVEGELIQDFPKYREEAPDNWLPVAFHLNGYEEVQGKQAAVTYELYIGKKNELRRRDSIGCTVGGEMRVVQKLWAIGKEDSRYQFKYGLLTLQDAIDLCEYFIDATARFQRFANDIPTVGGETDVALITPFHGFQWIKRKKLMKTLEASNAAD